jgi:hypothetical protein
MTPNTYCGLHDSAVFHKFGRFSSQLFRKVHGMIEAFKRITGTIRAESKVDPHVITQSENAITRHSRPFQEGFFVGYESSCRYPAETSKSIRRNPQSFRTLCLGDDRCAHNPAFHVRATPPYPHRRPASMDTPWRPTTLHTTKFRPPPWIAVGRISALWRRPPSILTYRIQPPSIHFTRSAAVPAAWWSAAFY